MLLEKTIGSFHRKLTATTALVAAAMLIAPNVAEACLGSVTLTTTGNGQQLLSCATDTLTVNSGASITNGTAGVDVQAGKYVNNAGHITATSGNTAFHIESNSALGSLSNTGTISLTNTHASGNGNITNSSTSYAAIYMSSGSSITNALTNSGTISAAVTGAGQVDPVDAYGLQVVSGTIGSLANNNGGTISGKEISTASNTVGGTGVGVYLNGGTITGALTNAGTISGTADNHSANIIHAHAFGVWAKNSSSIGSLTNSGTIKAAATASGTATLSNINVAGFYLDNSSITGALTNSGTIKASLSVPSLSSQVKGDTTNSTAVTGLKLFNGSSVNSINNNGGTIEATVSIVPTVSAAHPTPSTPTSVKIFAAGINLNGSTITNAITNSGTIKATATVTAKSISYDWVMGISATGTSNIGSITNSGTISGTAKSTPTATSNGITNYVSASGIYLNNVTFSGGITNSGTISGTATGVVANGGKIKAYVRGIDFGSVTSFTALTNKSGGVISGTANLTAQSGSATGTAYGLDLQDVIGSIDNAGTIKGTATLKTTSNGSAQAVVYGANITNGGASTTFTNSGTIEGAVTATAAATGSNRGTAYGLSVNGGTITGALANSGTIKATVDTGTGGASEKAYGLYLNGATLAGGFTNSGTVEGTVAHTSGISTGYGIYITGATTGTITNTGTIKGSTYAIYNNGGTVTLDLNGGTVTGDVFTAAGTTHLSIGGNFTTGGNYTVTDLAIASGDTLTVSPGNTVTLNNMTTAPVGTLALTVNGTGAGNFGALKVNAGPVNIANTGSITVAVGSSSSALAAGHMMVASGTTQAEVNSAASSVNVATVSGSSYMWNFALEDGTTSTFGTNNQLYLILTQNHTITGSATNSLTSGVATVLQSLSGSANPTIKSMISAINAAPTQTALNNLLQTYQPIVGGGAAVAAFGIGSSTSGQFSNREDALLDGVGNTTGMAAGDFSHGVHMWGQGFGDWSSQDVRSGISGYNAGTYGMTFGVDNENLIKNSVLGVAVSYAKTNVNSKTVTTAGTDVNSYQVALYGRYNLNARDYLSGMAAYGFHTNKTSREPAANTFAHGSYNANQFTVGGEFGRHYHYRGALVTPDLSLTWSHYAADGYAETGAGGADLTVGSSSLDMVQGGIGITSGWTFRQKNGDVLKPEVHAKYLYDFSGQALNMTAQLAGGGAAWTASGASPARSTFNVGGSLHLYRTNNWDFSANYDFRYKTGYTDNAVMLRAEYNF